MTDQEHIKQTTSCNHGVSQRNNWNTSIHTSDIRFWRVTIEFSFCINTKKKYIYTRLIYNRYQIKSRIFT